MGGQPHEPPVLQSLQFVICPKKCPADMLIPFAGTNGQDLCLDVIVTAGLALSYMLCLAFGIKGYLHINFFCDFRDTFYKMVFLKIFGRWVKRIATFVEIKMDILFEGFPNHVIIKY